MTKYMKKNILALLIGLVSMTGFCFAQEEGTSEEAADPWQASAVFEAGGDLTCQMAVIDEVEKSLNDAAKKVAMAEKCASFLNETSTALGRQFYCVQLRVVGTEEQVAAITPYLTEPVEGYVARAALTKIAGPTARAALLAAFENATEETAPGLMDSLAQLGETSALPKIIQYAKSDNPDLSTAAVWTLSKFGADGYESLKELGRPTSCKVAGTAAVKIARAFVDSGNTDAARTIYESLSASDAPRGMQRAAAIGLLKLADDQKALINEWLFGDNEIKASMACTFLSLFTAEEIEALNDKSESLNPAAQTACYTILLVSSSEKAWNAAMNGLQSDDLQKRLSAIRALGLMGQTDAAPELLRLVEKTNEPTEIAAISETFIHWGPEQVGDFLYGNLWNEEQVPFAVNCLAKMKCYKAIDSMIGVVRGENEGNAIATLVALSELCDPDANDLPRLLGLYVELKPGKIREQAERTIVTVCDKIPDVEEQAGLVLDSIAGMENSDAVQMACLPLLGKLGGEKIHELIEPLLADKDPNVQTAAFRAFCNWPNADYQEELWKHAENKAIPEAWQQMALRAYVRVVSLKSDRPESETLTMLQNAMKLAKTDPDRNWCLKRAAAVRTLESANWAAECLNDPALAETACGVIVELAHHRFLRQPNKARFEEILLQVEQTTKDTKVAEQAKKARLGM